MSGNPASCSDDGWDKLRQTAQGTAGIAAVNNGIAGESSEPGEILEEDYQRLLGLLAEEKLRIWNTAVSEKLDLMEYYTMWVHQIKTPIAALKLLIEEEADIPGEEEPLGEDRESLQQQREKRRDEELQQLFAIEQYVNMALSYMRLGSETTDFVLRQTDLDEVIRMAVRRYARHFISKKITLHYEETGARVLTDEKMARLCHRTAVVECAQVHA